MNGSSRNRTALVGAGAFLAAVVVTLALLALVGGRNDSAGVSSTILVKGDTWVDRLKTTTGSVAAEKKDAHAITIVYRSQVEKIPTTAQGDWVIRVRQDGAEGPFAAGWRLYYRGSDKKGFELRAVAPVGRDPMDAKNASVILGEDFPLRTTITSRPKSRTIIDRTPGGAAASGLPPELPDGPPGNAGTPPPDAPGGPPTS